MTLRGRWRSRWWISLAVVVFLVVVATGVALWMRSEDEPTEVSLEFLESTSCPEIIALSDDHALKRLGSNGCNILIDAATGKRTYSAPDRVNVQRTLDVGTVLIERDRAQVPVTVSYNGEAPPELIVIDLVPDGNRWRVHDWGITTPG